MLPAVDYWAAVLATLGSGFLFYGGNNTGAGTCSYSCIKCRAYKSATQAVLHALTTAGYKTKKARVTPGLLYI